jgi:hypothetical protein
MFRERVGENEAKERARRARRRRDVVVQVAAVKMTSTTTGNCSGKNTRANNGTYPTRKSPMIAKEHCDNAAEK